MKDFCRSTKPTFRDRALPFKDSIYVLPACENEGQQNKADRDFSMIKVRLSYLSVYYFGCVETVLDLIFHFCLFLPTFLHKQKLYLHNLLRLPLRQNGLLRPHMSPSSVHKSCKDLGTEDLLFHIWRRRFYSPFSNSFMMLFNSSICKSNFAISSLDHFLASTVAIDFSIRV